MESSGDKQQLDAEALSELQGLITQAKGGDASVLPRLREFFRYFPELWQSAGDLALQSQAAWIKLVVGEDKHLQEAVVQRVNQLKMDLSGHTTDSMECLLVERVISTWLSLYYFEMREAQHPAESIKLAELRLKQIDAAHNRHTKAIAALAAFRKLMPSVTDGSDRTESTDAASPNGTPSSSASSAETRDTCPAETGTFPPGAGFPHRLSKYFEENETVSA